MKRIPLYFFVSGLVAVLTYKFNINLEIPLIIVFLICIMIKNYNAKKIIVLLLLFFILIFLRTTIIDNRVSSIEYQDNQNYYEGEIISFPIYKEDRAEFVIRLCNLRTKEKVQCFIYNNTNDLSYGDIIGFYADAEKPEGKRNPGGFDYRQYLISKNIYGILYIKNNSLKIIESDHSHYIKSKVTYIRKVLIQFINKNFTVEYADFLRGIILGEKIIDIETADALSNLGISHILAVSGLHIGFIYIFLKNICKLIKLKRSSEFIIISVFLFIYSFIVGFSVSVIRASLMLILLLLTEMIKKKYDTINILSVLASIFLLLNPFTIFNVGFQLSYCAVLSISVLYPYLNNLKKFNNKIIEYIKSLFLITLSVQLGTTPLILYYYNNFSLISLIVNLLVVPLVGLVIICFIIAIIINIVSISLANMILIFIKIIISIIYYFLNAFITLPYVNSIISPMPIYVVILYYTCILMMTGYFYMYKNNNKKIVYVVIFACLMIMIIINIIPKPLIITFFDVGQGDSILIECPMGENILIDGGGQKNYSVGDNIVKKAILNKKIKKLDLVVCTHSHDDHMLGIIEILDDITIDAIVINCIEEQQYDDLLTAAKYYSIPVFENDKIIVELGGEVNLDFLYPYDNMTFVDENNSSIVTKLTYKSVSLLFMGDLELEGEKILLSSRVDIESDIVKIGHHGSKTSSGKELLDRVNANYGIISVGRNNYFGHPHQETLELLDDQGIKLFRTDQMGAIEIRIDGENILINTFINEGE
ncbi:MAG: DNA internalization-related competence protein ComEC/Rec2 [Eubacteriaceae bacterium]